MIETHAVAHANAAHIPIAIMRNLRHNARGAEVLDVNATNQNAFIGGNEIGERQFQAEAADFGHANVGVAVVALRARPFFAISPA